MGDLFGMKVVETEEAGDNIYLMPALSPVVFIPSGGFSPEQMLEAEHRAIIEAAIRAARRGETAVIRNIKQ